MKKLLAMSILLLSTSLFSNELLWVDEQVEAIKPPRKGMNISSLSAIKDPFVFLKKEEKKETSSPLNNGLVTIPTKSVKKSPKVLTLSLILNNSAMINNVWYKKGDKVSGYNVAHIDAKTVLLTKKKKQLLLSTKSSNKNLKFNNK
jgi:hypothetical protein